MTWPMVRLGELLDPVRGRETRVDGSAEYPLLGARWYAKGLYVKDRKPGSAIKASSLYRVDEGDFVYNRLFAWKGSFAVATGEQAGCFVSNEFPCFKVNSQRLDPRFLWLYFSQERVWNEALGMSFGATPTSRNRLKEERLLSIVLPLPPLAEQRRIVAKLDELAGKVEEARELAGQAGVLGAAVITNQAGAEFSRLSGCITPSSFGSLSAHVTSGPRNWARHYENSGSRFYRAQDIGRLGNVTDESKVFIAPPPGTQGRIAQLRPDDLMIVITGATVGRVAVYREGLEPGFVSQHVAICRFPRDAVVADFALWGLRSPAGQAQLLGQRYGQGKPGLNLSNIKSLTLPFPSPPEQRQLVARLRALEARVNAASRTQAASAAEMDALGPAILDRAFGGEL